MAKTKTNRRMTITKKDEKNIEEVDGAKMPSKEKKLSKPLKRNFKPSRADNPPTGEMVLAALKALKNDKGVVMQTILKYLKENYGGFGPKIGKERRKEIKAFIADESEKGRIQMTNGDDKMEPTKRVNMVGTRFKIVDN